jgi:hypothetical protein
LRTWPNGTEEKWCADWATVPATERRVASKAVRVSKVIEDYETLEDVPEEYGDLKLHTWRASPGAWSCNSRKNPLKLPDTVRRMRRR